MKTLFKTAIKLVILNVLTFILGSLSLKAYDNNPLKSNQMDKIEQFKKMKMLDYLNLSEENSEKFLIKYTQMTKKIKEKRKEVDDAAKALNQAVKDKKKEDITSKTDAFIQKQQEMMDLVKEMQKQIRSVLSEEEFARYLLFERNFNSEVRRMVQKNLKESHGRMRD